MISQVQLRGNISSHSSNFYMTGEQTGPYEFILQIRFVSLWRVIGCFRLEGTSGDHLLNHLLKPGSAMKLAAGSCPAHSLTQTPEPFPAEPHSSQAGSPQPRSSQVQDLAFAPVEYHKVSFGPFLQPVWVSLVDNLPLSTSAIRSTLMSSANLMRVTVATSRLFIKNIR